jgi:hypothetical protein
MKMDGPSSSQAHWHLSHVLNFNNINAVDNEEKEYIITVGQSWELRQHLPVIMIEMLSVRTDLIYSPRERNLDWLARMVK